MSRFVISVHPTASLQVEVERGIKVGRHGADLVDLNLDFISRYCNVGGGVGGTETLDSFSAPFIASFALFLHCHANEEVEHGGAGGGGAFDSDKVMHGGECKIGSGRYLKPRLIIILRMVHCIQLPGPAIMIQ